MAALSFAGKVAECGCSAPQTDRFVREVLRDHHKIRDNSLPHCLRGSFRHRPPRPVHRTRYLQPVNGVAVREKLPRLAGEAVHHQQNVLRDLVKRSAALAVDRDLIVFANHSGSSKRNSNAT